MEGVRLTPVTWERLTDAVADRVLELKPDDGGERPRVAIDGAPATRPDALGEALTEALRLRGRPVVRVRADTYWRPASQRYELGRHDPDAFYERWLDTGALWREAFGPLAPGGTGRVLPSLWDPVTDRATRAAYEELPPGGVLLLEGALLQGYGFPFDLCVHLRMSGAALARRTPEDERWTLPAYARYEQEAAPAATADVVVHTDDPRHPAWTG
ncbi:uridine kinase [Actinacidiphila glaucinigra]|uniref:uridine kinase n=1 Tax=Actinacidiphila glaucinigra TaxID=235986 RepID=UPI00370D89C3